MLNGCLGGSKGHFAGTHFGKWMTARLCEVVCDASWNDILIGRSAARLETAGKRCRRFNTWVRMWLNKWVRM
jgi:hypothetical protein